MRDTIITAIIVLLSVIIGFVMGFAGSSKTKNE